MEKCRPGDWQLYHSYEKKECLCRKHNVPLVRVKTRTVMTFDYQGNTTGTHDYMGAICPTWKEPTQ